MKTARFEAAGGRLSAEILCEPRRDGSYELRLWHRDLNKILREWPGNFIVTDDDRYDIPNPPTANDGRFVQALAVIAVPPHVTPSRVTLVVRQKEKELARESQLVEPDTVDKLVQLWIALELVEEA
jgi:hypothetical protein